MKRLALTLSILGALACEKIGESVVLKPGQWLDLTA